MLLVSLGHHYKIPQTQWFKQQIFISPVLKVRKAKTKVLANSVPGEDTLAGLQMTTFSAVSSHGRQRVLISLSLLVRTLIPPGWPHPHDLI